MFVQWSGPHNGSAGLFALRGTLPCVTLCFVVLEHYSPEIPFRYLINGNVLAARTFIRHFVSSHSALNTATSKIPVNPSSTSVPDCSPFEVSITSDPTVNFCQMAVLTCQRANGDKSKTMREAWVRLCGTYQSKGGALAQPEVRKVRFSKSIASRRPIH